MLLLSSLVGRMAWNFLPGAAHGWPPGRGLGPKTQREVGRNQVKNPSHTWWHRTGSCSYLFDHNILWNGFQAAHDWWLGVGASSGRLAMNVLGIHHQVMVKICQNAADPYIAWSFALHCFKRRGYHRSLVVCTLVGSNDLTGIAI